MVNNVIYQVAFKFKVEILVQGPTHACQLHDALLRWPLGISDLLKCGQPLIVLYNDTIAGNIVPRLLVCIQILAVRHCISVNNFLSRRPGGTSIAGIRKS